MKMKQYEKDRIIFVDRQGLVPNENDTKVKEIWMEVYKDNFIRGPIRSDGTIAWDCPCLGTQAIGPCSVEFRRVFSCYHASQHENKGIARSIQRKRKEKVEILRFGVH